MAQAQGLGYSSIGLALDYDTSEGLELLSGIGKWDEISVGRSWYGSGAQHLIWETDIEPFFPQLVVARRSIRVETEHVAFSELAVLQRFGSPAQAAAWLKEQISAQ